jgi:sirohydrochlorin ferrochelatase
MSAGGAKRRVLLLDNGSLEPAAILRLREIAAALGMRLRHPVEPVSLLHSDRVAADLIGGRAAELLEPVLERCGSAGTSECVILPFFIGPSRALTEYVPAVVARVGQKHAGLRVILGQPLHAPDDDRLARILAQQVREILAAENASGPDVRVALVDHGSPARAVTAARDRVAEQLAECLGATVAEVAPCSMERRPGAEYDFNEPLLENLLGSSGWDHGLVVVAQLFLLPGRHAGKGGDIERICAHAEAGNPRLRIRRTGQLGDSPLLLDVLADRCLEAGG